MSGRKLKPDRLQILFHIVMWAGIIGTMFSFIRIYAPVEATFALAGLRGGVFVFLFYFHSEVLARYYLLTRKYLVYSLCLLATLAVVVLFRRGMEELVFRSVLENVVLYQQGLSWITALISTLAVTFLSLIYKLGQWQLRKERRDAALIARQREAEIQLLRAQLNPHFLFNMLNNIYALSITQSPKAPEMILKLSELLRYVTYESREAKVQLSREIAYMEVFISIFHLKSAAPLPVTFEVRGNPDGLEIEPLLLLPLLENAFKHCDWGAENAFLQVKINIERYGFSFEAVNSKSDSNAQKDMQGGVGLENIRKRLELREGNLYQLEIQDEETMFSVLLTMKKNGKNA